MAERDTSAVPDYPALLRQDDRNFVVFGAGNGIGRQVTHALSSVGARVVCVDIDADLAKYVADEVDGVPATADVTDTDSVRNLFATSEAQVGPLHGVVDIVGIGQRVGTLEETPTDLWDSVFNVNAKQCFYVIQAAAPYLRRSVGSSMTFVSSVGGLLSAPRVALYGAAKAALSSLVRSAAIELGPSTRVNCIAPANTLTPRLAASLAEGEEAVFAATHPVGRMGRTEDQAAAILFLASELASFITGQSLIVDGGLLLNMNNPDGRWPGERLAIPR